MILRLSTVLLFLLVPSALQAGVAKEAIDQLWKRFGKGALGESAEQFGRNLDELVAKHGDDCLSLVRKGGHDAYRVLNEVGEGSAEKLVRLYGNKGDDAWPIINTASKRNLFLTHGDEAAEALIKHPGIADDLISEVGPQTASTIAKLSKAEAQLLHKMHKSGDLGKILTAAPNKEVRQKFWQVLSTYGDKGLAYVWKNKGSLAVAATLVAFVSNPEAFIGSGGLLDIIFSPVIKWLAPFLAILATLWLVLKLRRRKKR